MEDVAALVTVDGTSSSEIIDIAIMDGGRCFCWLIPLELLVLRKTTPPDLQSPTGSVNRIYDNRNDTINITGINDYDGRRYNTQYRITSISGLKKFEVEPLDSESPGITTTGLGIDVCRPGAFSVMGPSYDTCGFVYNRNVGLVTITTNYARITSV